MWPGEGAPVHGAESCFLCGLRLVPDRVSDRVEVVEVGDLHASGRAVEPDPPRLRLYYESM